MNISAACCATFLGNDVEKGELPNDEALVGDMVRRICYQNARDYLGLERSPQVTSSRC